MASKRKHSPIALKAAEMLGLMIRSARLSRSMTAQELADRAGVSRQLLSRVEKGDVSVSLGSYFEISAIIGVPLFEVDEDFLDVRLSGERRANSLLRQRSFQAKNGKLSNDF